MEEGEAGLRKGSKLNKTEVSWKRQTELGCRDAHIFPRRVRLQEARRRHSRPQACARVPEPGSGPAASPRERGPFATRGGTRGRVPPPRGSPAPPGLPPRAARRRPAPARLIGCRSKGRRRGGRGDLISDADSLLRPVVPDPAAAGARRAVLREGRATPAAAVAAAVAPLWEAMGARAGSRCPASGGLERPAPGL